MSKGRFFVSSLQAERQHGLPRPTQPAWRRVLADAPLVVGLIALIFGMLILTSHWDEVARRQEQELVEERRRALQAQIEVEVASSERIARAYEQGQVDALAAAASTPAGLQLAQACLALGVAQGTAHGRRGQP